VVLLPGELHQEYGLRVLPSPAVISPDGSRLYAAGWQRARWTIEAGGNLTNLETFSSSQLTGRAIIGLAFDPNNANNL